MPNWFYILLVIVALIIGANSVQEELKDLGIDIPMKKIIIALIIFTAISIMLDVLGLGDNPIVQFLFSGDD